MIGIRVPEKALRRAIFVGIALLVATPFVVTPGTIFPFVLGKALWSRSLIEIVFALWAVLALARPRYRPPRSRLLLLLGAGVGVSLLAAFFGVSPQRSLWSSYERMQGAIDTVHWFALAAVLASMLRSPAAWRTLLGFNAAAGAALAGLVVARHFNLDIPFYGAIPEFHLPRMSGPLGNPTYLSVCMLFNLLLALGFLARSGLPGPPSAPAPEPRRPRRGRHRRRQKAPASRNAGAPWPGRLLWAGAAALLFWGLALAGSVGGFVGLYAGIGFAALAYAWLGRARVRWTAAGALAVLVLAGAGFGARALDPDRTGAPAPDRPIAGYVLSTHIQRPGVQSRLAAWEAGLEGFAARPVLGWGPENFGTVFGRHASGYGAFAEPHDNAHSKLVEVAATTGALGLLAWLALWATAFLVLWRAAWAMEARERALTVFAGAALFGALAQSQFLFDTAVGSLQSVLLLGFAVSLEAPGRDAARRPRLSRAGHWGAGTRWRGRVRFAAGVAAVALGAAGLASNRAIHAGADVDRVPRQDWSWRAMGEGIDGFGPLANTWRWWLFNELVLHWPRIRAEDGPRALALLDWAEGHAQQAVRTEPREWRIRQSLARLYRAAAATDPEYESRARAYRASARELAPNRAVFPGALEPPHGLEVLERRDGAHELRWRPAEGAGYVVVSASREGGPWRHILHAYDPARTSFVPPEPRRPGTWHYRIKACRYPRACSTSVMWPPIVLPAGGADRGSTP